MIHLVIYLKDHQGATLKHVVGEVQKFIDAEKTPGITFRLAGGNAGVAAATNEAVEKAEVEMLGAIFGAIILLCWLTFRPVSYTHLDVYKRQGPTCATWTCGASICAPPACGRPISRPPA